MTRGIDPNSIPRYTEPTWDELAYDEQPECGACWNCAHMAEVKIVDKTHCLCVHERDDSASGDVYEAYANMRECPDWAEQ